MTRLMLLLLICFLYSCKPGTNTSNTAVEPNEYEGPVPTFAVGQNVNIDAVVASKGKILEDACSIVPLKVIADALNLTPQDINLTNSTPRDANRTHSSCFFKWESYDLPNAGILIQMLRNPNETDFPDYVVKFVESFRVQGENGVETETIYYKKLEGFGDDGSYSIESAKYYWRLGDKIVFSIAFNTTHGPEDQYRIATTIGKALTENYLK